MEINLEAYNFFIKPGVTENVEKLQMLSRIIESQIPVSVISRD